MWKCSSIDPPVFTKIFYRETAQSLVNALSSFEVKKKFNLTEIEYASSGFKLSIDIHQPVVQSLGAYAATLTTAISGQSLKEEMTCQLAGENDGMIWPAKVLVPEKTSLSILSADKGTVFTSFANKTGNEILKIDLLSTSISLVKNVGSSVIVDLGFTADQKNLLIKGDLLIPNVTELFKFDLASLETTRLTYDHSSSNLKQSVTPWSMSSGTPNSEFLYGSNLLSFDNWVVYLDSDENANEPYFSAIYAYDLNTNVRRKLTPDLNDSSYIRGFSLLPNGLISFDMVGNFKGTGVSSPLATKTYGSIDVKSGAILSLGTDVLLPAQADIQQSPTTISYVAPSRFIFGVYQVKDRDVLNQSRIALFSSRWDGSEVTEIGTLGTASAIPSPENETLSSLMEKNLAWKYGVQTRLISQDKKIFVMTDKNKGWIFYNTETNKISPIDVSSESSLVSVTDFKVGLKSIYGIQFSHVTGAAELILMDEQGNLYGRKSLIQQGYRVSLEAKDAAFYFLKPRGDGSTDLVYVDLLSLKETIIPNSQSRVDLIFKGKFSDDGLSLIFMADADNDGKMELYRLGLDGSGIVQISNRYFHFGGVTGFEVLPSNRVFFKSKTLDGSEALFIWKL